MKTIQEQIEVMKHFANGGKIQCCANGGSKYEDFEKGVSPSWNWNKYDYCIKGQKKNITIEKWLCEYTNCELLEGSKRFFILEKVVPFEFGNGRKVKLLESYEVEL